jgi:hypothetical protein
MIFHCGHCMSEDTYEITAFKGKRVIPEDVYNDNSSGIVVKCRDCGDITGYLVIMTGVVEDVREE